jgi:hypothetical protein
MVFFFSFSLASDWRKIPCLFISSYPVFYLQPCAVILETLTKISKFTGSSALMSAILSLIAKGAPIFTAKTIALIFGVAVADPTPIVELLLVVAVVTAAISLGMTFAGDDLQNVNNALVKSGAYQNGGTISASPMSLTITTSTGTTTVNSQVPFVSMLSLYIWAEGYYP